MPIEVESPEETGYGSIDCNLAESSIADADLDDLGVDLRGLVLRYGDHRGLPALRELVAADGGRPLPADATPLGAGRHPRHRRRGRCPVHRGDRPARGRR